MELCPNEVRDLCGFTAHLCHEGGLEDLCIDVTLPLGVQGSKRSHDAMETLPDELCFMLHYPWHHYLLEALVHHQLAVLPHTLLDLHVGPTDEIVWMSSCARLQPTLVICARAAQLCPMQTGGIHSTHQVNDLGHLLLRWVDADASNHGW